MTGTPDSPYRDGSCARCYFFKLKWKDGYGVCWHTSKHSQMVKQEDGCEHYEPRVVLVVREPR